MLRRDNECAVCYGSVDAALEPCGHPVCAACARRWRAQRQGVLQCPVCRQRAAQPASAHPHRCTRHRAHVACVLDPAESTVGVTLATCDVGVCVTHVEPAGPAHRAGLRVCDILTHVDGERVTHHAQAAALVRAYGAPRLTVDYLRASSCGRACAKPQRPRRPSWPPLRPLRLPWARATAALPSAA